MKVINFPEPNASNETIDSKPGISENDFLEAIEKATEEHRKTMAIDRYKSAKSRDAAKRFYLTD